MKELSLQDKILSFIKKELVDYPTPSNIGYA